MKNTNKLTQEQILSMIKEEAGIYKRKIELYNEVKKINSELKTLNEGMSMCGTHGFKSNPDDVSNKSHNGFVNSRNISHIADLAMEMGPEENEMEMEKSPEDLKMENEILKREIEELKQNQKQ